jgi:hypothetical protein
MAHLNNLNESSVSWECVRKAAHLGDLMLRCSALQATDGVISAAEELAELRSTIEFVRSSLVPALQRGNDVAAADPAAKICIKDLCATLDELAAYVTNYMLPKMRSPLPPGHRPLSTELWRDQRIYLYQLDFLLKQQMDQFNALFAGDDACNLIEDIEGQQLWVSAFGRRVRDLICFCVFVFFFVEFFFFFFFVSHPSPVPLQITMVPWHVFWKVLVSQFGPSLNSEQDNFKLFLNFTRSNHVSAFEFSVFLKWFGSFKQSTTRFLEALHGGLICGFVPALEAKMLLESKQNGTYLIRMSKTHPGSYAVTFTDSRGAVKHCVRAGSPVALSCGLSRPIEQVAVGDAVVAWKESRGARDVTIYGPRVAAHLDQGRRPCVSVRLEDGRELVVTGDHRILALADERAKVPQYVEAQQLTERHRVVCAALPPAVLDDSAADDGAACAYTVAGISMATRDRMLALARIVGVFSAMPGPMDSDAHTLLDDYACVFSLASARDCVQEGGGMRPDVKKRLRVLLKAASMFALDDSACPRSVQREFVAAWLGRVLLCCDEASCANKRRYCQTSRQAHTPRLLDLLSELSGVSRALLHVDEERQCVIVDSYEAQRRVAESVGVRHARCAGASLAMCIAWAASGKLCGAGQTESYNAFVERVSLSRNAIALRVLGAPRAFADGEPQQVFDLSVPKYTSFVANGMVAHNCLLYSVQGGVTLRNPPTVYGSLKLFANAHTAKLKFPRMALWGQLMLEAKNRAYELAPTPTAAPGVRPPSPPAQENEDNCIVCWSNPVDSVFVPCGHMACCRACAGQLSPQTCPICRQAITQVVNVYRP